MQERGSAIALLEEEAPAQGSLIADVSPLEAAEADVARWKGSGMTLLTVLDPQYPANLRSVRDRPPLIFLNGHLEPGDTRALAVVGARESSAGGRACAAEIAAHLVGQNYTVASGMAAGIDTAAHTAALAQGGRTIAVIGAGLSRCYPPENAALQRRIAAEGAVISQFWPSAPPSRLSFPMRNAVTSGLTLGTTIVEASVTSGSRMQARLAIGQRRPLFLVDALLTQPWAQEYAALPGTHVVGSPEEITRVMERITPSPALIQ